MSNLTLTIGGRDYVVACAEGEEAHVTGLGRLIDAKMASMGSASGHNETRSLLFAALLLADEVHELKAGGAVAAPAPTIDPARVEALAARLENIAATLEG